MTFEKDVQILLKHPYLDVKVSRQYWIINGPGDVRPNTRPIAAFYKGVRVPVLAMLPVRYWNNWFSNWLIRRGWIEAPHWNIPSV